MEIKADLKLLEEQILECDIKANNASSDEEQELFDGLAEFLSAVRYNIEHNGIAKIVAE